MECLSISKLNYGELKLFSNQILIFTPTSTLKSIETALLKSDINEFIKIANDSKILFIYDGRTLNDFTSEQKALMQKHLPLFSKKMAILSDSGLSKFFSNLFLYLYKPEIPIKIFNTRNKAIDWLLL